MKGVIAPLYVRSVDDMDIAELCELLDITSDDIKERFSDKITEMGLEKSHVEYDTEDDDREVGLDLYDTLDENNEGYYDEDYDEDDYMDGLDDDE